MRSGLLPIAALLYFPCISICVWAGDLALTEDPNAPIRLEEYLQQAALHNAGLQSAYEQWRSAMLAIRPAGTLDDPRLEYNYFIQDTPMGERQRLGLMQMFPWFGVLEARTDAAAAAARAAGQRYEAEYLDLVRRVKEAFYEYGYLARAAEIARQNLDLLSSFEQVAQARYRTAAGAHPDIIRAQIELAEMEDNLIGLEQMRRPASADLSAILNRPAEPLLPWPTREKADLITPDTEKLGRILLESNPDLKAIRFETVAARREVDLADKRHYPDIGVGVEWMFLKGRESGMSGNDRDPIALMFSINLPIWTDSYRAKANQARSQVIQVRRQEQQREHDLAAEVARTVYDLDDSRRKAVLYRDVLAPKAREMVRASEDAYRAGNLDFLSLIDAQRKQLMFELAFERSLASHLQQKARLEQLLGADIPGKE